MVTTTDEAAVLGAEAVDAVNVGSTAIDAIAGLGGGPERTSENDLKFELDLQLFGKKDIRQINDIAREFDMDNITRREFGDYVESLKDIVPNNKNFSYSELREIAKEFLEVR